MPASAPSALVARPRFFNTYVLRVAAYLYEHYSGLGYNVKKQFMHKIPFHTFGAFLPMGGGFGFRHAFFCKTECPSVPSKRDCQVIYSEKQNVQNVGQMLMPFLWKRSLLSANGLGA